MIIILIIVMVMVMVMTKTILMIITTSPDALDLPEHDFHYDHDDHDKDAADDGRSVIIFIMTLILFVNLFWKPVEMLLSLFLLNLQGETRAKNTLNKNIDKTRKNI